MRDHIEECHDGTWHSGCPGCEDEWYRQQEEKREELEWYRQQEEQKRRPICGPCGQCEYCCYGQA